MGVQTREKLNQLQHNLPSGLVVDAGWLERHGYSRGLRKKYVTNGWLVPVARTVYSRPLATGPLPGQTEKLHWQNVVVSLQTMLGRQLVVGGRTALELQGFSHYLSAGGPREVHLYGEEQPPGWLVKLKLDVSFEFHNTRRLFRTSNAADVVRQPWGEPDWPLAISSPERAILELLDELPERETFHQADVLMEGLSNLSPRRLQRLLEDCGSVKVKRLFLWFADRHDHAWLRKIDRSPVDLGRGKRLLVRGGKLDPKYGITVPETLSGSV